MTNDEKLQDDRTRVTRSRRNILKSILCLPAAGLIGSAAASYTVSADSENTLTLYSGWNLVGVVDEVTVEELENESNPNVTISSETVYQWNSRDEEYDKPSTLRPGSGYWVKVSDVGGLNPFNSEATFNFQQQRASTTQIYEGWNMIAVSSDIRKPELKSAGVFDGLEPRGGNLFFKYDAEEDEYLYPEKLSPAEGYWVYASESKSVVTGAWYTRFRDMAEKLKKPFMNERGDALERLQTTLEQDIYDLSLAVAGAYVPGVALADKATTAADAIGTALEATVNWSVGAYREEWSKNIPDTTKENYDNKLGYPDVQDKPIRKLFSSWIDPPEDEPDIWENIFVPVDEATPEKRAEGLQNLLYKLEATEQATSLTLDRQKGNDIVDMSNGKVKNALDKILTAYVELLQLGIGVVRANLRNYYPNRSFAQTIQNLTQPTADKVANQIRNGEACQRRYANDRLRQLEESGQVKSVRRDSKNVYKTTGGQQITLQGQGQTVQASSESPPPVPSSQTVTPIVEQYDQNDDGDISVEELGEAGQDFAADELTIEELAEIGQEFAND